VLVTILVVRWVLRALGTLLRRAEQALVG